MLAEEDQSSPPPDEDIAPATSPHLHLSNDLLLRQQTESQNSRPQSDLSPRFDYNNQRLKKGLKKCHGFLNFTFVIYLIWLVISIFMFFGEGPSGEFRKQLEVQKEYESIMVLVFGMVMLQICFITLLKVIRKLVENNTLTNFRKILCIIEAYMVFINGPFGWYGFLYMIKDKVYMLFDQTEQGKFLTFYGYLTSYYFIYAMQSCFVIGWVSAECIIPRMFPTSAPAPA